MDTYGLALVCLLLTFLRRSCMMEMQAQSSDANPVADKTSGLDCWVPAVLTGSSAHKTMSSGVCMHACVRLSVCVYVWCCCSMKNLFFQKYIFQDSETKQKKLLHKMNLKQGG